MSAAEPATPNPRDLTTPDGAAVIDITKRGARKAAQAARGRWQTMNHKPPHTGSHEPIDPHQAIAQDVEARFYPIRRTLTDDETALIYRRTLDIVQHTLEGAKETSIISEEQRNKLHVLFEGMKAAPDLL
ncbi:hypothetical protein [Streptomyces collinus]|uniref:hypothetical protein n=1 Tax=Streptomyces collinus TaxID=42684 RepID=UPI00380AFD02